MTKYIISYMLLISTFFYGIAQQHDVPPKKLAQQIETLIKAQNYDKAALLLKAYQTQLTKVDGMVLRAQVDSFQYRAKQSNQQIADLLTNYAEEMKPSVKEKLLNLKSKNDAHLSHFQNVSESANETIDKCPFGLSTEKRSWFSRSFSYFINLYQKGV
ncbi:hypothetical protein [Microscilla marina]|uniref:Iron hydrogenase small subunit domain protein n=1 Tax=Microscilla marina ATCC 23134 TaxID=313606 RepID=A1ZDA8_MICM2|nr:hypothetical protein [Microscilla marina]EAY31647.1 iron hydrogenase small subunit domain protein [Microscilla marina ATCC 23134]